MNFKIYVLDSSADQLNPLHDFAHFSPRTCFDPCLEQDLCWHTLRSYDVDGIAILDGSSEIRHGILVSYKELLIVYFLVPPGQAPLDHQSMQCSSR